jgi:3-methyl-2-oxobutanoate hydroxymethyltransferase
MSKKKITISELKAKKEAGGHFAMITVYDYPMAALAEKSAIELILVGDSLGMVIQGLDSTVPVTMKDMLYHTEIVRRGAPGTFVVGDMSFMSYQASKKEAVRNAGRLMRVGADCVKMEGNRWTASKVEAVVKAGMPVMGHIGLTPQTASAMGGFKLQGKDLESAKNLMADALAFEEAGAFALVLECLPTALAQAIHKRLNVPTVSCGAGPGCTGYNLNAYDLLGMFDRFVPKFVKQYRRTGQEIAEAFDAWRREVEQERYPLAEHSFNVNEAEISELFK